MTDFGPTLVEDTFAAARRVLPLVGCGYMLDVERRAFGSVTLRIGYLYVRGHDASKPTAPLAEFRVYVGDDVEAAIHENLPGLPLCGCGCGVVVQKAGQKSQGCGGGGRRKKTAATPDLSILPSRGSAARASATVPYPGASSKPGSASTCEGGLAA